MSFCCRLNLRRVNECNTKPPFRADHVGSLLRPAALKEARSNAPRAKSAPAQLKDDRRSRDRARDQEAGGSRPASRSPTANSAAPGGISIFSGASMASRSM